MSYKSQSAYNNCNRCSPCGGFQPVICGNISLQVTALTIGDIIIYAIVISDLGPTPAHNVTVVINSQRSLLSFPGSLFQLSNGGRTGTAVLPLVNPGEDVQLSTIAAGTTNTAVITVTATPSTCSPTSQTIITNPVTVEVIPERLQGFVDQLRSIITVDDAQ